METNFGTDTLPGYMSLELARAARKLIDEVFPIKAGESVAITADTTTDERVVGATAQAIFAKGAHPVVIWYEALEGAAENPPIPVGAAVKAADAWIEYAPAYLLHGPAHREAIASGCRFLCMTAVDVDALVRMIGQQDPAGLGRLEETLRRLSEVASRVRITSPAGTDLITTVSKSVPVDASSASTRTGRTNFPPGASGFGHVLDSVQGTLVFDGAIFPPKGIGVLRAPVVMEVKNGFVQSVTGEDQARYFKGWLAHWNTSLMYQVAHFSYGCNPGVRRCSGRSAEDARVFGSADIGLGITASGAPTHSDGIVLNPSVWADNVLLEDEGTYVHPELVSICKDLGLVDY